MSAYVIFDITVKDPEKYEEYKKQTMPTIAAFGGRFIVRGGQMEVLEGNWQPNRIVILEFESIAKAKAWLNSPEYSEVKKIRHSTAVSNAIVVEGFAEPL